MPIRCPKCGSPVPSGHGSCFDCGAMVSKGERDPWDRSDVISRRQLRPEKDRCSATPASAKSRARVTKNNDWISRLQPKEEAPSRFGQVRVEKPRDTFRKNDSRTYGRQPREELRGSMSSLSGKKFGKKTGNGKIGFAVVIAVFLFILELLTG